MTIVGIYSPYYVIINNEGGFIMEYVVMVVGLLVGVLGMVSF